MHKLTLHTGMEKNGKAFLLFVARIKASTEGTLVNGSSSNVRTLLLYDVILRSIYFDPLLYWKIWAILFVSLSFGKTCSEFVCVHMRASHLDWGLWAPALTPICSWCRSKQHSGAQGVSIYFSLCLCDISLMYIIYCLLHSLYHLVFFTV